MKHATPADLRSQDKNGLGVAFDQRPLQITGYCVAAFNPARGAKACFGDLNRFFASDWNRPTTAIRGASVLVIGGLYAIEANCRRMRVSGRQMARPELTRPTLDATATAA